MIYFPHPLSSDDDGLLAIGGDLSVDRLRLAYRYGIFPWYNEKPILWWFTHPRCILYPKEVSVSKSMRSLIKRKRPWQVSLNCSFTEVIDACANIERIDQNGTWITSEIREAYIALHEAGEAHSVEVTNEAGQLIGGLYGVVKGKIFYGESMFATEANTSKYALIHLAQYIDSLGCTLIDCQQDTKHMRSMGAILIDKMTFWEKVKLNVIEQDLDMSKITFDGWLNNTYSHMTS